MMYFFCVRAAEDVRHREACGLGHVGEVGEGLSGFSGQSRFFVRRPIGEKGRDRDQDRKRDLQVDRSVGMPRSAEAHFLLGMVGRGRTRVKLQNSEAMDRNAKNVCVSRLVQKPVPLSGAV
jgi:hypothetical protein